MAKKTYLALFKKSVKAYGVAIVLYIVLIGVTGLLLCYGPLPEKWIWQYMLAAESVTCLFLGYLAGSIVKKRGLFYGMGYAAVFLLLLLLPTFAAFGDGNPATLVHVSRILPLVCGGVGGILGVNGKN